MMNKADFLKMSSIDQEILIKSEFPDFEMGAYNDILFGIFYDASDEEIEELFNDVDSYDDVDMLRSILPKFNESRFKEIVEGNPLTETEKLALRRYLSEQNAESWTGLHGWKKTCDDGDVFLVFYGFSEGQGGIRLEYFGAFETEKQVFDWLETFEFYSYI